MLCIPITGPSSLEASHQIAKSHMWGDIFEFRLDLFSQRTDVKNLRKNIKKDVIFTLRKKTQGGSYVGQEEERLQEIMRLAELSPTYFDLEYDVPLKFAEEMTKKFPKVKLIISYHDFKETPADLEGILKEMRKLPASIYKMACLANTTDDSFRMLDFVRRNSPILGICMGERGKVTRTLGPIVGAPWTFGYISGKQKTAQGQLPAQDFRPLRCSSAIYGLIGAVAKSISHFTHNKVMQAYHLDATYVKMELERGELEGFFSIAKQINIQGLSVTMPLKEHVIPFLDEIDPYAKKIGAVNTILFQNGKLIGFNTDGKGALDAIENKIKVHGKQVVILGAGGAARAIAYEAMRRGADVCILNRTKNKALDLAREFGVNGGGLDLIEKKKYDILINATADAFPILKEAILPSTHVMEITTFPKMNDFLKVAEEKKCTLIFGYEMFIQQALEQFEIWFGKGLDRKQMQKVMEEEALNIL